MDNSKILLNINIGKTNYCIFSSKSDAGLTALAITKSGNSYFVTDTNEVNLLNTIISMLNKKYIRRKDIIYKNKKLARFEHRYNGKSYFAEIDYNGNLKECSYEQFKELYDLYNGVKILCDYNDDFMNDSFDHNINYSNRRNNRRNNRRYNRRNDNRRNNNRNNFIKKVSLIVGGVLVVAFITTAGIKILNSKELPSVDAQESSVSQEKNEDNLSQIQKEFGEDVDIIADNEDEEHLQDVYKSMEKSYREKGIPNWQIAAELDFMASFREDDINFYYDSENDQIIYVFEKLADKKNETEEMSLNSDDTNTKENDAISQNIQIIIDAINDNENLSSEEKEYIIQNNLPIWEKNEKYLNFDKLALRYKNLTISYSNDSKQKVYRNTYAEEAAGYYVHGTELVGHYNGSMKYLSHISLFNSTNFEEVENSDTFKHELNHINGDFTDCTLLNEGYNQLIIKSTEEVYINEQLMAILFSETFGRDVMNEGYFGFDLSNAITNKIVEITGRDNAVVNDEVYNLLEDTQNLLLETGEYTKNGDAEIKNNKELVQKYEKFYEKLSEYHKIINGKTIEENNITNFVMDCITGTNRANVYQSDKENFRSIDGYDIDSGTLNCIIGNNYENLDVGTSIITGTVCRNLELTQENKYEEKIGPIKDSDINYVTR